MLDGRVKTLHPAVHGGILRDGTCRAPGRDRRHGIQPIDLVAVNLYPFQQTVAEPGVAFDDAVENIDIGGPSMLRSAAKNHTQVIVIADPLDYPIVLQKLREGGVDQVVRRDSRQRSLPTSPITMAPSRAS
jgi:phosphoribosylaminoimidazolecarboxamide formyltransferase/IMP cyclohydrolase